MLATIRAAHEPFLSLQSFSMYGGQQQPAHAQSSSSHTAVVPHRGFVSLSTQHVSIGGEQAVPMLARVSVCDFHGAILYDTFVLPTHPVSDYRNSFTGLEPQHLQNGVPFATVQRRVADCLGDNIVIGHQLWFDFAMLNISHRAIDTRDVALFLPFRTALGAPADEIIPLQTLVWRLMRHRINAGYQHPLENARAALDLYRSHQDEWESFIRDGLWACALPPPAYARFFL